MNKVFKQGAYRPLAWYAGWTLSSKFTASVALDYMGSVALAGAHNVAPGVSLHSSLAYEASGITFAVASRGSPPR